MESTYARDYSLFVEWQRRKQLNPKYTYQQYADDVGLPLNVLTGRIRRAKEHGAEPEIPGSGGGEQVIRNEDINNLELETKSTRIHTLEQLLQFCEVDLRIWAVEKYTVNKWEVGAKDPVSGEILIEPLYQVKAFLIRKIPEAIRPVIQPVIIKLRSLPKPRPKSGLLCNVTLPDSQFGFLKNQQTGNLTPLHDLAALDVALQIVEELKPDQLIWLGDLLDLSEWSDKFLRDPAFYFTTQPAINAAGEWVHRFNQHTSESIVLDGNHEDRLRASIITHLLAAFDLKSADNLEAPPILSIDNLLGLSRAGIKYISGYPDNEVWLNDSTKVVHGDKARSGQGATAKAVVAAANETTIFGHIHRIERATKTIRTRTGLRTVSTISPGCLCHIDGRVPGSSRSDQWQQGIAITWFNTEYSATEVVEIHNGKAIYNGRIYQAR